MKNELTSIRISDTNYLWRRSDGVYNITGYNPLERPQDGFKFTDYELLVIFEGGFTWAHGTLTYWIDDLRFTYEAPRWEEDRINAAAAQLVRDAEKVLKADDLKDFRL